MSISEKCFRAAPPPRSHLLPLIAAIALLVLLFGYGLGSLPELLRRWGSSGAGIALLVGFCALATWLLSTIRRATSPLAWSVFAALAVALRIGSAAIAASRGSPGDSHYYLVLAQSVLSGHGLVVGQPLMGITCHALYPPFYALVLAGWGAVAGFATPSLLTLSTVIDCGAAALIAAIGIRLGRARAGRAAAALYLIWPSVLFSAPLAQKEGLCLLLILALAHAWLNVMQGRGGRIRQVLTLGVPSALLALTQPGQMMLAPLFGLALLPFVGWRRMLAVGAPAAAVALVMMLPWWIRNWLVLGSFVPLTTSGGLSLWIGNNPDATGNWMPPPTWLYGTPEVAFSKAAGQAARDWIAQHPLAFARLNAAKFFRAVAISDSDITRLTAMTPPLSAAMAATLFPLSQGAHLLVLAGSAIALRVRRDPAMTVLLALLLACFAQLLLFGVWFEFSERHRTFLVPFLLLIIASAAGDERRATP